IGKPLALEGPFPIYRILRGGEVVERGNIGFRADEIAADVARLAVALDVLADEIRRAPAQTEEVFVARLPRDFIVLRLGVEICIAELAAVHLYKLRRGVRVRPIELHLHPDRPLEPVL